MSVPAPSPAFQSLLHAWDAWLLNLLVGVVFPAFAYLSLYRKLKQAPAGGGSSIRRRIYLTVIAAEWLLVAGLALVAYRHKLSLADLGQHLAHPRRVLAVTLGLMAVFAALAVGNLRELQRMPSDQLEVHLGRARKFIPEGKWELILWTAMALTTGICEELLFRGWMLPMLGNALGSIWIGLVLSSLLFGFAHAFQGPKGILATGIVGLALGLVYVLAGSLLPGQILHALVNLVNGFIGSSLLARMRGQLAPNQ